MKRWLFNLAAGASLLLSLAAAAAWAMSYAGTGDWLLLGMAHSEDLMRVNLGRRNVVHMTLVDASSVSRFGYWDAGWARSQSGRLTLVAHAVDYDGKLRRIYASPPSVTVELSAPARARAMAFARLPESRSRAHRVGFAWGAGAQQAADGRGGSRQSVSARASMIMLPYWFLVLLGVPLSLLWLRANLRTRRSRHTEIRS